MKELTITTVREELTIKMIDGEIIVTDDKKHRIRFAPSWLVFILQEYQRHFKITVPISGEWRGIIGSPDLGMTDPNHWFMKDEAEEDESTDH